MSDVPLTLDDILEAMGTEDAEDGDERTLEVLSRNNIEAKTREGYNKANKRFVLWLFSNKPGILNSIACQELRAVDNAVHASEKEKKEKRRMSLLTLLREHQKLRCSRAKR